MLLPVPIRGKLSERKHAEASLVQGRGVGVGEVAW